MIHELTHVWQYVKTGLVYIPEAIAAQNSDEGYEFGGVAGLKTVMTAGGHLSAFNVEQQGEVIAHYFDLRQQARTYEAIGQIAPLSIREDLDVYIYFVKEVSTLTATQLDTPNRIIKTNIINVLSDSVKQVGVILGSGLTPTKTIVTTKLTVSTVDAMLTRARSV